MTSADVDDELDIVGPAEGKCVILTITGPSCSRKTTLEAALTDGSLLGVGRAISYTTRDPRPGEGQGVHYHFVTESFFREEAEAGSFLETVAFDGHNYGLHRDEIARLREHGCSVIVVVCEPNGCRQISEWVQQHKDEFYHVSVILNVPDLEVLLARYLSRYEGQPVESLCRASIVSRMTTLLKEHEWATKSSSLYRIELQANGSSCIIFWDQPGSNENPKESKDMLLRATITYLRRAGVPLERSTNSIVEARTLAPPRVVCAAIRNVTTGQIILGARHYDMTMRKVLRILPNNSAKGWRNADQGFIDQHGNYLTRKEAWVIADRNGQIIRDREWCTGSLHSEHLY